MDKPLKTIVMMLTKSRTDLLVARLKNDDNNAFQALYYLHSQHLSNQVRRLVADREAAKDIVQETFLRFWLFRKFLRPDLPYIGLLHKISQNLTHDYLRKEALSKRHRLTVVSDMSYCHVEEGINYTDCLKVYYHAIKLLPGQCGKIYRLNKFDSKSHNEISRMLAISPATVNNQLVIANRKLRSFMKAFDNKF